MIEDIMTMILRVDHSFHTDYIRNYHQKFSPQPATIICFVSSSVADINFFYICFICEFYSLKSTKVI